MKFKGTSFWVMFGSGMLVLALFGFALSMSGRFVDYANHSYDAGFKQKAKFIYTVTAWFGNPEGHFNLAYRFVLPEENRTFHLIQAAQAGHGKALEYAMEDLFFRSVDSNPEMAWKVYNKALSANPSLKTYYGPEKMETVRMCVEAGRANSAVLETKFDRNEKGAKLQGWPWELAERAANTNLFGKRSTLLALQLVCHSPQIPAEIMAAVPFLYNQWKRAEEPVFNACDFATSKDHVGACMHRDGTPAEYEKWIQETYASPELD